MRLLRLSELHQGLSSSSFPFPRDAWTSFGFITQFVLHSKFHKKTEGKYIDKLKVYGNLASDMNIQRRHAHAEQNQTISQGLS